MLKPCYARLTLVLMLALYVLCGPRDCGLSGDLVDADPPPTGVVTFGAGASPAGIRELNFTGNVILDMSANVTAIAGTWTGRAFINAPVAADLAAPAPAPAEPAIHKIGQIIPILAHGAWTAFNRQNIIQ